MPPGKTHQPNRHLQPFVPVRPGERTQLYSNRELCAITSTDPRNELEEMSEPFRFQKDVTKPQANSESEETHCRSGSLHLTFLAGAAFGAVVAILATPKNGFRLNS